LLEYIFVNYVVFILAAFLDEQV